MKKKMLRLVFVAALTVFGVTKFCFELGSEDGMSSLLLKNVEALAQDGETTLAKECYDRYDSYGRKSTRVRICETCDYATVFNPKKNTICPK